MSDQDCLYFRTLPLGDISLQREIGTGIEGGVVYRQLSSSKVRRIYSATIQGQKSVMTVASYQGQGAKEVHRFRSPYVYSCH